MLPRYPPFSTFIPNAPTNVTCLHGPFTLHPPLLRLPLPSPFFPSSPIATNYRAFVQAGGVLVVLASTIGSTRSEACTGSMALLRAVLGPQRFGDCR